MTCMLADYIVKINICIVLTHMLSYSISGRSLVCILYTIYTYVRHIGIYGIDEGVLVHSVGQAHTATGPRVSQVKPDRLCKQGLLTAISCSLGEAKVFLMATYWPQENNDPGKNHPAVPHQGSLRVGFD